MGGTMTKTEQVLIGMLKENTGSHMCDSGGFYGRHWQKNQDKNFMQEPEAMVEFAIYNDQLSVEFSRNVFHFLKDRLELNEELNEDFKRFLDANDYCDYEAMQAYCDLHGYDSQMVNTYNGECNLSQTLQFITFGRGSDLYEHDHILLQIHQGCDVRGGYSTPMVFDQLSECALFGVADGSISCSHCDANWTTDDSYHWYHDGCCGLGAGTQLENYDATEGEHGIEGKVVVTEDGEAFCPMCSQGKLTI